MVCPANRSSNISVTGIRFRRSNIPTTTRFEWVGGPHNLAQRTHGAQQFGARPPARRLRGGRPHNRQPPGPTGVPASCPRDGGFHRLPARLGNARQHHPGQTVHERKQGLLGSPVVSENRIARWAMRERLSTCKGMVEAVWDGENRKSGAHRKRDAGPPKRIPPEPQPQQQKDRQKIQQRIPTLCSTTRCLAVWERLPCWHYQVFGCLGASSLLVGVAICRKLFPTPADNRNRCRLFTNCCHRLQTAKIC